MNGVIRILGIFALGIGMSLAAVDDADARRFGGGRTLGSKQALSRSAQAPRTPSQQAASAQNQQARQQLAQRGGLAGMLGGLAIGGLLGALFFGGAFENVNMLDILLFGGIAFALFKLFAARQRAAYGGGPPSGGLTGAAFAGTDDRPSPAQGPSTPAAGGPAMIGAGVRPADFDEKAFLAGARRAFQILQDAWKDGDLSGIRGLTTGEMFAQLQEQLREPDAETFVEVLSLDARLLDVRQVGTTQEASVLFDAVLRESASERPAQVRELWHFTRTTGALTPTWFLDGIEQMQD